MGPSVNGFQWAGGGRITIASRGLGGNSARGAVGDCDYGAVYQDVVIHFGWMAYAIYSYSSEHLTGDIKM